MDDLGEIIMPIQDKPDLVVIGMTDSGLGISKKNIIRTCILKELNCDAMLPNYGTNMYQV
jgi:hypothetical protein